MRASQFACYLLGCSRSWRRVGSVLWLAAAHKPWDAFAPPCSPLHGGLCESFCSSLACALSCLWWPGESVAEVPVLVFSSCRYWISEKYPKTCCYNLRQAPIIVCNHVSYFDALYFGARVLPAAVVRGRRADHSSRPGLWLTSVCMLVQAKSAVANYPIVGSIIKAMQVRAVTPTLDACRAHHVLGVVCSPSLCTGANVPMVPSARAL